MQVVLSMLLLFAAVEAFWWSYFSIYNDTNDDIWVWDGANWDAITYSTLGVIGAVLIPAAGGVALGASGTAAAASAGAASASAVTLGSAAGMNAALAVASGYTATAATAGLIGGSTASGSQGC